MQKSIGVIGYTKNQDQKFFNQTVKDIIAIDQKNTDYTINAGVYLCQMSKTFAKTHNIKFQEFKVNYANYYKERLISWNRAVMFNSDIIIIFNHPDSKLAKWGIKSARQIQKKKPLIIHIIECSNL